jgi:polyisoprenoid-binding protein YceI
LNTGNDDRDNHLPSADFFDVDTYPTITFDSTLVRALPNATWEVMGDLTVRDTTRPVILQVDFDGAEVSPIGDERIGFSAATDINREDFGLTWNMALETGGLLVGKNARIELSVQAVASTRAAVA